MPAVIEVRAHHSIATESVNVHHWRIPNSAAVTEANAAINALDAFYTALIGRIQTGVIQIDGLVRTVDQGSNFFIQGTTQTASCTGTVGAPLSLACCIAKKSNFVGGSRRGRIFVGPLTAACLNTDGRTIASAPTADFGAAALALFNTTTSGIEYGVWSRKTTTFTPTPVVQVNTVAAQQRRRLH